MSDEEPDKPQRDEKGRLLPGNTANPTGKNGQRGQPDLMTRQEFYETHYTIGELLELTKDKDRFSRLSPVDAQIITHMVASVFGGKERGKERERYYNRKYGTPVHRTEMTGLDGSPLISNSLETLRSRLLSPLTEEGEGEKAGPANEG